MNKRLDEVTIVGGGTAGWLTAMRAGKSMEESHISLGEKSGSAALTRTAR